MVKVGGTILFALNSIPIRFVQDSKSLIKEAMRIWAKVQKRFMSLKGLKNIARKNTPNHLKFK